MKFFLRILTKSINWLVTYCLGPADFSRKIVNNGSLCLHKDDAESVLSKFDTMGVIVIALPHIDDIDQLLASKAQKIILVPRVLEDTVRMLEELRRHFLYSPVLFIAHNLSKLPSKSSRGFLHYGHVFARECMRLKRMAIQHDWQLLVIDREEIIGKKNSALLRALFIEHSISNANN